MLASKSHLKVVDLEATPPAQATRPELATAVVQGPHGLGFLVRIDDPECGAADRIARRAKSCLVAPDPQDRVLCTIDGDQVFVLAVLEGSDPITRIATDGELSVHGSGKVRVSSAESLDLIAAKNVAIHTRALELSARLLSAAMDESRFVGRVLKADLSQLTVWSEQVETRSQRLVQRVKRAFRFIEDIDQMRAGTVDHRAEKMASLRGENTVVSARSVAKIDAAQVHLG